MPSPVWFAPLIHGCWCPSISNPSILPAFWPDSAVSLSEAISTHNHCWLKKASFCFCWHKIMSYLYNKYNGRSLVPNSIVGKFFPCAFYEIFLIFQNHLSGAQTMCKLQANVCIWNSIRFSLQEIEKRASFRLELSCIRRCIFHILLLSQAKRQEQGTLSPPFYGAHKQPLPWVSQVPSVCLLWQIGILPLL